MPTAGLESSSKTAAQIPDTIAQTELMIYLGIHRAKLQAGESNHKLRSAPDATSSLYNSAM